MIHCMKLYVKSIDTDSCVFVLYIVSELNRSEKYNFIEYKQIIQYIFCPYLGYRDLKPQTAQGVLRNSERLESKSDQTKIITRLAIYCCHHIYLIFIS